MAEDVMERLTTDNVMDILSGGDDDKIDDKKETKIDDAAEEDNELEALEDKEDKEKKEKKKASPKDKDDEDEDDDNEDSDDNDDEDEDDDEEEPEFDEDDEELTVHNVPRRAELKKEFPDIFKKFPALDHVIQREKAYADVFPTLVEAKEAKDRLGFFSEMESELLGGGIEGVLKSVKKTNEDSYNKIVDSILPTIGKIDNNALIKINTNVLKGTLKFISDSVKGSDEEASQQLAIAVKLINKAVFGTHEITGPDVKATDNKEDPEKSKLKTEREEFERSRMTAAVSEVTDKNVRTIKTYVEKHIDEKEQLPSYVKTKLIEDVMKSLDKQMGSDTRFRATINRLWLKSREAGYSTESKNRIREAILNQVKSVINPIMRAKKVEAMKGLNLSEGKSSGKREESRKNEDNREPQRKAKTFTKQDGDRKAMKDGESVRDFFMRD